MSFYTQSLFIAIPIFSAFIILEWYFSKRTGIEINRSADVISSLSSGMSNITKDSLKIGFVLVSYSWLVEHLTIYKLEPIWLAVFFAFLVQDFTGYWMHRLNHRVNIFWNKHVIHHSSEEFNLSCALRQSISETIHFSALLMIPAALLGIPSHIFSILAPIHLFMQFWYHTRIIGSLGFLEKFIVTPSHHRVHHAINSEYLDKNYGQILIIWDKMFGSFQKELKNVEPIYGILRPAKTWNPILINFKHLWQLIQDAYRTKYILDKIRIWFMPTGWRPEDVKINHPIFTIQNLKEFQKYNTHISNSLIVWSYIQLIIGIGFIFHFFPIMHQQKPFLNYFYGLYIMSHIFAYTSLMDKNKYAILIEFVKIFFGLLIIYIQNFSWFGLYDLSLYLIYFYFMVSMLLTIYFSLENKTTLKPI